MTESFLHYVWQFQYFEKSNLLTMEGEQLTVFNPGILNGHAGPDFANARLKIGGVEWVGNVEIHINASNWLDHHHHNDRAYENVVLHVVWKNDKPIKRSDGSLLPTLELKNRVDDKLLFGYKKLLNSPEAIPCSGHFSHVESITKVSMIDRALFHRLERKSQEIFKSLEKNQNDWQETCYHMLGKNFGFKINADPFLQLVQSIPCKIFHKHSDKLYQIEALLFGQAGFLDTDMNDPYFALLKREYHALGTKYDLITRKLHPAQWRFLRLRPSNFPTIRIAQFASLLYSAKNIFSKLLDADSYEDLFKLFKVQQSEYWQHHYQFASPEHGTVPSMGAMSIHNIIINTAIPILVSYGKRMGEQDLIDRAVAVLTEIPAEENSITSKWTSIGQQAKTAFDSQALIELYNNFCQRKTCLECTIGSSILKPVR
jgi:hypothetical protein